VNTVTMGCLRRFLIRFAGLFRKGRQEREMEEEFESHFRMHVEENLGRGMGPAEAWREARLKFGGVDQAKESLRDGARAGAGGCTEGRVESMIA